MAAVHPVSHETPLTHPPAAAAELRAKPNVCTVGFLIIEMVIGYEWFISGLVKIVRGNFPSGLAGELMEKTGEMAPWYAGFIESFVVPNGVVFGYAVEIAEILAGIALIGAPLLWLFFWSRVSDRLRALGLLSVASAAIGATFLAINLHFANGASHPWLIPGDAFDEGIDLDSVLPAIQVAIATVSIVLFRRINRQPSYSNQMKPSMTQSYSRKTGQAFRFMALAFGLAAFLFAARPALAQTHGMPADAGMASAAAAEEELPHPFFTHMGLPEGVGVYSLRVLGIAARADGRTTGDFAFHFETGITERIGLHIRNDRFRTNDKTEAMFQFAAYASKDGMTGFAPLIEFEIPTRSGASGINTLVGFTTSAAKSNWVFNQVVHYDPKEDMVDASVAVVVKASANVFPVVELLGDGGKGQTSAVNLLGGLKVRLREGILFGLAYQVPLTTRKDFASQVAFGPDFDWKR